MALRSRAAARWRRESGWRPENLRKPEFSPSTIIDVGTGWGTPVLYEAFPDAYLVLIEPLREFERRLRRIAQQRGEYLPVAVGAEDGTATIHVDPQALMVSSILRRAGGEPRPVKEREIPIRTLDSVLNERDWRPPFGLKIDTEGFDHHVVEGATSLLEETQFVISEVSVAKRYEESYSFAEFIALMRSRRFGLCDILDGEKSEQGEIIYLDAVFKRMR